ncbi:hypothetical protein TELCIR_11632 [Teladorsagia circumcincta]|uniref:Uncharacterized protein n=1 Tax=Teladorsagia circumcincta TaxID=45464 RepID=A0A2G9U8Q7_TELCI|nr:hypothetical protein TELCIR_11632 [Teladorsagia circumcincta]
MRNLVQCLEYAGKIRADIWELIIDQMIMCDNMLAKSEYHDDKNCTADTAIFDMDEEQQQEADSDEDGTMAKLDGVVRDVLCYIAMKHGVVDSATLGDASWLRLGNEAKREELFSILLSLLESRMLLAVHVRYSSFIWLYICSLDESCDEVDVPHCELVHTIRRQLRNN